MTPSRAMKFGGTGESVLERASPCLGLGAGVVGTYSCVLRRGRDLFKLTEMFFHACWLVLGEVIAVVAARAAAAATSFVLRGRLSLRLTTDT